MATNNVKEYSFIECSVGHFVKFRHYHPRGGCCEADFFFFFLFQDKPFFFAAGLLELS